MYSDSYIFLVHKVYNILNKFKVYKVLWPEEILNIFFLDPFRVPPHYGQVGFIIVSLVGCRVDWLKNWRREFNRMTCNECMIFLSWDSSNFLVRTTYEPTYI